MGAKNRENLHISLDFRLTMDSKLAIAGAVGGLVGGLVGAVAVTLATRGKSSTRSSSSSILIFYPQSEFEDCRHLGNRLILISTTGRRSSIRRLHTGDPRSSGILVHRDIVYLSGQVGVVDENAQHGNKSKIS